jgi:hypothetical protein
LTPSDLALGTWPREKGGAYCSNDNCQVLVQDRNRTKTTSVGQHSSAMTSATTTRQDA